MATGIVHLAIAPYVPPGRNGGDKQRSVCGRWTVWWRERTGVTCHNCKRIMRSDRFKAELATRALERDDTGSERERVRVSSSGYVGIGQVAPAQMLSIK